MQTQAKAMTECKCATTSVAASKAQKKTWGNDSDTRGKKKVSKWVLKYIMLFFLSIVYSLIFFFTLQGILSHLSSN